MPLNSAQTNNPTILLWESADTLAAKQRLQIAKRYQEQFARLDQEYVNLSRSRSSLINQQDNLSAQLLIDYLEVMLPYLRRRGLDNDLLQWSEDCLLACQQLQQNPGWFLMRRGGALNRLGRWSEAKESFLAAIEASRDQKPQLYAEATLELGRLMLNQGNYQQALGLLEEAKARLTDPSNFELLAITQSEVAAYHLNRGELDQALALYQEADQLRRQAGSTKTSDHILMMLGVVHRKMGNYDFATDYLEQLLARGETEGNRGAIAPAAHHLAWTYLNLGELAQARHHCGRAMSLYEEMDDPRGVSDAHEQLGLILLAEARDKEAIEHLKISLQVRTELGNQQGAASSLRHLALAYWQSGQRLAAAREMVASLRIYWQIGVLTQHRFANIWREFFEWRQRRRQWTL